MVKGNDVIGLKVITVNEGKEVGEIKDLIYDPDEHMVKALLLDEGGWFSDAKVILTADIQSIGSDAVIIPSLDAVKKASDVTTRVANIAKDDQYLTRAKIVTVEGTELGSVTDIYFDPKSGKVSEFEVSQNLLQKMESETKRISVSDIVTVGQDATIVKNFDRVDDKNLDDKIKQERIKAKLKTHEVANDVRNRYQSAAGSLGGKSKHRG